MKTIGKAFGSKLQAGDACVSLDVFFASFLNDLCREFGARRGFVPVKCLEVVANELFVEARLAFARGVEVSRPKA